MKKKWLYGMGSLLLLLALTACGGGNSGNDASEPQTGGAAAVDAQAVYKANCLACHGADMKGKTGPALEHAGTQWTSEEIREQIENGGGGMPGFKRLGDDKINALVDWLSAMK